MKSMLSFVVLFVGVGFLFLLGTQNAEILAQTYVFRLDVGYLHVRFMPARIDVLLLLAVAFGFSWSWVVGAPRNVSRALELRRLRKQVRKSEQASTAIASVEPAPASE